MTIVLGAPLASQRLANPYTKRPLDGDVILHTGSTDTLHTGSAPSTTHLETGAGGFDSSMGAALTGTSMSDTQAGYKKTPIPDVRLDQLELRGEKLKQDVIDAVTGGDIERTIEGASVITITLRDQYWRLLRGNLFDAEKNGVPQMKIDGHWFELVAIGTSGPDITLTFQPRVIAWLERYNDPLRAKRQDMTRAEFILSMVREVKEGRIVFVCPELHKKQPVEKPDVAKSTGEGTLTTHSQVVASHAGGLDSGKGLTAKGSPLSAAQVEIANRMLRVCDQEGADHCARVAVIMAGINESLLSDPSGGDRDSVGVLQVRFGRARTVEDQVRMFLREGATGQGGAMQRCANGESPTAFVGDIWWGAGQTSYPGNQYLHEAQAIVDAYGGSAGLRGGGSSGTSTKTITLAYTFSRGRPNHPENSWQAGLRLAREVRWRLWENEDKLYYISEDDLFRAQPRFRFNKFTTPGVLDVQLGDWDYGKKVGTMTVVVRAHRWQVDPGGVVIVEQAGPFDGRWLVHSIKRPIGSRTATVELRKPMAPKPEPANPTKQIQTQTASDTSIGTGGGGESSDSVGGIHIVSTASGPPYWCGSAAIIRQFATPFMAKFGLSPGNCKRTPAENAAAGGAPGSDHLTTEVCAYACDYPTSNGEGAARALAKAMGYSGWQPNSYSSFTISVDGHSFSVQILWGAAIGHDDHVHVGVHTA